jgi:hypothetical protein
VSAPWKLAWLTLPRGSQRVTSYGRNV